MVGSIKNAKNISSVVTLFFDACFFMNEVKIELHGFSVSLLFGASKKLNHAMRLLNSSIIFQGSDN